ncbi:MAG: malate synthase G [Sulfurospirillaceae bacterium]|nr:malate synthase G [Sulfurospirillaceae bacterium]
MNQMVTVGALNINRVLYDFIKNEALPQTPMTEKHFWEAFERTLQKLVLKNLSLLQTRDLMQTKLDAWYLSQRGKDFSQEAQKVFLKGIGYLVDEVEDFVINPLHVDPEITSVAGPQLVVPSDNARYALNAANARWGSLLDVFYGTDMIDETLYPKGNTYNPQRGEQVFALTYAFLDDAVPLESGSYEVVKKFFLKDKKLLAELKSGYQVGLKNPEKFVGYLENEAGISSILLKNNGLHVEIQIDRNHFIGQTNSAGIKDVVIESATSAIQDCEDSVSAVDASDKVGIYRNWNGLMRGNLEAVFENKGKTIHRKLNPDKTFLTPEGETFTLKGRVLLLVRNVGIHMYTDAVTFKGEPIPEGFLDAFVTSLCAIHDLQKNEGLRNSVEGSIYIVKPKCHGPQEIAFVSELFDSVEEALGLAPKTIKMGIMDEERRTSANLKACIAQAKERVFFINTGFLDRTGDEIHSVMELGAVLPKEEIKKAIWLGAYENQNVDVGIEAGFVGHAQIGKGMWTMPDLMKKMVELKIAHPLSGANTAWVPSPTAATLHALHYHQVDVPAKLQAIKARIPAKVDDILTPPMLTRVLTSEEIQKEIENNIQSILGYVVRWIDQGIGCSKVPDINNVELMEDRATLRISSQHVANWLHHGIVSIPQVQEVFEKMAVIVDEQNSKDINYQPMAPNFESSIAFQAALDLVFKGRNEPNGYTEFILHRRRREVKLHNR